MEPIPVTLGTVCEGAVEERFAEKLAVVLANIDDPNTLAKTAREIVIRLTFSPSDERDVAAIGLSVEAKLAPNRPVGSTLFIGRKNGKLMAIEQNPKQASLFNDEPARPTAVAEPKPKGA